MSRDFIEVNLTTLEMGRVSLLRTVPRKRDPWGVLAPLKGTDWGALIQVVTGEDFSDAMNGFTRNFVNRLGRPPEAILRRVPECHCVLEGACSLFRKERCRPQPKVPECFDLRDPLKTALIQAWREGRYVIVVEGKEFI